MFFEKLDDFENEEYDSFEDCPTKTVWMSNIALVHLIACIVYLVLTYNMDTPFKDSLSEEQKKIKRESAQVRKRIYITGVLVGILVLYLLN